MNGLIQGDEIHTSIWMPGAGWTYTPLQVLYTKSARLDEVLAAKQFDLLTFYAFMHHPDDWITGRFEMDGDPPRENVLPQALLTAPPSCHVRSRPYQSINSLIETSATSTTAGSSPVP